MKQALRKEIHIGRERGGGLREKLGELGGIEKFPRPCPLNRWKTTLL